ncbi:MAG: hypothetical protein HY553_08315, partial [Elusimicrobia bacterium]|nr:hypothetical protein [Elusimicrobiota bacterium]
APPGADLDGALANLAALKARLEPSSKRLEDMRYGSLEDLSTIDPERAVLRAELEAGGRVLDEKLDALEALKRAAVLVKFQKVAAGGLRPGNASDLNAAVRLTRAGDDFLHLQGRVRAALAFDEKFYRERKAELDAHERARARRRNIAAAACFVVAAFGAVAVFVKLR